MIDTEIFSASIDESFAQAIKKRSWYSNSPFDRKKAFYHKRMFQEHRLPYEIKRVYLESIGYEIIQPELWRKKPNDKPKSSILQPNAITLMSCDFTQLQMKVLIIVLDKLQATIDERMAGYCFENTTIYKQIDDNQLSIKIKYADLDVRPNKYGEVKTDILQFSNVHLNMNLYKYLFLPEFSDKPYSGFFLVKIPKDILKQLVDVDQGITKYIKKIAITSSKYGTRIYMLICMWKDAGEFQMNLDTFKKWLQLEYKYSTYQEIYKSVIHPVYEELFEKTDCWFEMTESFDDGEIEPYKLNFKVIKTIEINNNN